MTTTTNRAFSSGHPFDIAPLACMQQAEQIKSYKKGKTLEPWSKYPPEIKLLFKVAFISICHQINWDYLQNKLFEKLLKTSDNPLSVIAEITTSTIHEWLADYNKKDRIRAAERARLIRNIASTIKEHFNNNPLQFFIKLSQASIGGGEFEKIMDLFEAYKKDPLKKKTNVLTHEICSEKIYQIIDEHNIEPAVDYHIIRLYLRSGRVVPRDTSLFKYFQGAPNPRNYLVTQLRKTVSEAVKLTAHYAKLNIAQVNFIEWQLGRSVCTNITPACQDNRKIVTDPSILKLISKRCPYIDSCTAIHNMEELISFEEPIFISSHY